jgi:hypothetical protein
VLSREEWEESELITAYQARVVALAADFLVESAGCGRLLCHRSGRTTTRLPIRKRRYVARELTTTHGIAPVAIT